MTGTSKDDLIAQQDRAIDALNENRALLKERLTAATERAEKAEAEVKAWQADAKKWAEAFKAELDACSTHRARVAALEGAGRRLINVFDEQRVTVCERIIVGGKSDAEMRREGMAAMEDLRAALSAPPAPTDETLDARMKAAGMVPLSDMLSGKGPIEPFLAHVGVCDMQTFGEWLAKRYASMATMRAQYELGDRDKADELYEWVFSYNAALGEVMANWRKATAAPATVNDPLTVGAVKESLTTEDRNDLADAVAYLRDEADFNRSWTDGRRKSCLDISDEYTACRLSHAEKVEKWARAIERAAAGDEREG